MERRLKSTNFFVDQLDLSSCPRAVADGLVGFEHLYIVSARSLHLTGINDLMNVIPS